MHSPKKLVSPLLLLRRRSFLQRHALISSAVGDSFPNDVPLREDLRSQDDDHLRTRLSSSDRISPSDLLHLFRSISSSSAALRLFDYCRLTGLEAASHSHGPFAFQAIFELAAREHDPVDLPRLKKLLLLSKEHGYTLTPESAAFLVRSFSHGRSPSDTFLAFRYFDRSLRRTPLCNHVLSSILRSPNSNHRADALSLLGDMLSPDSPCPPDSSTCSILFLALSRGSQPADDEMLRIVVKMAKNYGIFPTDTSQFTKVVVGLCRAGRTAMAWDLVHAINNAGGAVKTPVWNSLLTGLSKDRDTSRMKLVLSAMEAYGSANVFTYGIVINHLCKSRNIDYALEVFGKMTQPDSAASPDTVIFNNLIDGLCKVGRTGDGLALLNKMKTHHCDPNTITFNTLINGFCKAGDIQTAEELMARMDKEGVAPNIVTLNTVISGMCKIGMVSTALSFFHQKKAIWDDAKGNTVTYCTLIGAFLHANNLGKAMELFNEMIHEGNPPDAVTYFTLISGLSMAGRMDDASSVASRMKSDGFQLDTKSYNILIAGFGKRKKVDKARQLFEEMKETGIKPDVITYNTLIDTYSKAGDLPTAQTLLTKMMDDNCKPSLVTYGALIHGFCKNGDRDGAVKIFQSMQDSKLQPNSAIYNILIDSFCKGGDIGLAFELFDEMKGCGLHPNAITYNAMMRGLCEKNMSGKAFELMEAMRGEGCDPDFTTMEILTGWLPAIGETGRLKRFMQGKEASSS
ncbi:hypothetical protein HPP92_011504 [Vanilla planifolia]|uniref:Pentatricopeptide repeat-containing protein n=1 Tax=Vanilla planifolia TaxID=51239 RepID=A0A835R0Q7_VANPL|nr:hypothetical protein HPP92_011504 [Vanilla planifolia]